MPACRSATSAGPTSGRGGSSRPASPRKTRSLSACWRRGGVAEGCTLLLARASTRSPRPAIASAAARASLPGAAVEGKLAHGGQFPPATGRSPPRGRPFVVTSPSPPRAKTAVVARTSLAEERTATRGPSPRTSSGIDAGHRGGVNEGQLRGIARERVAPSPSGATAPGRWPARRLPGRRRPTGDDGTCLRRQEAARRRRRAPTPGGSP